MTVEIEPRLSAEALADREGSADEYSLDIVRDPDDPELQAELAKDIDYNDDSASGALTYLYRDGELWSVNTDENGRKRLVRNSEILHGDMLTQYQEAMTALAGGATDHSLEVRASFLDTETEEFYSRQKLEFVDSNHIQISHELFSQTKKPDEPTPEDFSHSYLDGPTSDTPSEPDMVSWLESFDTPESPSPESSATPGLLETTTPKPAESIIGALEPKPAAPQTSYKAEPKADSRAELGPLQWLHQPVPEPAPKPEKVFGIPAPKAEVSANALKQPVPEAPKPESKSAQKPSATEQSGKTPKPPEAPQPGNPPEPTGGRAVEQPAEIVATKDQIQETAAPKVDAENIHIEAQSPVVEAPSVDTEASIDIAAAIDTEVSVDTSADRAESIVIDAPSTEVTPTSAESTPAESQNAAPEINEAVVDAAPIKTESITAAPEAIAQETLAIAETPVEQPAILEENTPVVMETQTTAEPTAADLTDPTIEATGSHPVEAANEQARTEMEEDTQPGITLETATPVQGLTFEPLPEIPLEQPAAAEQAPIAETFEPLPVQTEQAYPEEITTVFDDGLMTEDFIMKPAEITISPISTASSIPAAPIATYTDATVQASAEGLDITMSLDESTTATRRQTQTRPAHLTVGGQSAPQTRAQTPTGIPVPPAEIQIPHAPAPLTESNIQAEEALLAPIIPLEQPIAVPIETLVETPASQPEQAAATIFEAQPEVTQPDEPIMASYEPSHQPVKAKLQDMTPELQSWADDFGAGNIVPTPEPITAQFVPEPAFSNAEAFSRPALLGAYPTNNQYATGGKSGDDDPGLVISFDQSERRHTTGRSRHTRSTVA